MADESVENKGGSKGGMANLIPIEPGRSGNPGGRPKNPFPALIRKATGDGAKLVEVAFALLSNPSWKAQAWACEYLRDTGWHKPVQPARTVDEDGNDVAPTILFVQHPGNPKPGTDGPAATGDAGLGH